jgi:hypothetical protein
LPGCAKAQADLKRWLNHQSPPTHSTGLKQRSKKQKPAQVDKAGFLMVHEARA